MVMEQVDCRSIVCGVSGRSSAGGRWDGWIGRQWVGRRTTRGPGIICGAMNIQVESILDWIDNAVK